MYCIALFVVINLTVFAYGETTTGRVPDPFVSPLSWPLASVSARIFGTKVTVNIGRPFPADSSSYTVLLDGERAGTIPAGSLTLELPLKPDTHIISVVKSNEAMYGEAMFYAFDIENGQVESYIGPTRKIEIIGDSISTGYGNLGPNAYCVASASNEDSTLTYGPLAATSLNAQINLIAYSGKGLYRNYDSSLDKTMPTLWNWVHPNDQTQWNTSLYQPDVVLVNLGTNDVAGGTDILDQFQATYLIFLQRLRSSYSSAKIILGIGPLLNGKVRDAVFGVLENVINATDVGDVYLLDFGIQTIDSAGNGAGCEYHPSLETHRRMAGTLENTIR